MVYLPMSPDSCAPYTATLKLGFDTLQRYEARPSKPLRVKAMAKVLEHIRVEDESSGYVCVGPLNKVLNAIVWHVEEPGGEWVRRHLERRPEYLRHGEDGVKVKSYNSSEVWDTAFAVQAIASIGASVSRASGGKSLSPGAMTRTGGLPRGASANARA